MLRWTLRYIYSLERSSPLLLKIISKDSQMEDIAPSLPPRIGNGLSKSCAKPLLLPSPLSFKFSKLSEFCFINGKHGLALFEARACQVR